jgi:hypothetical protein
MSFATDCALGNCPSEFSRQEARPIPFESVTPFEVRHLLDRSYHFAKPRVSGLPLRDIPVLPPLLSPLRNTRLRYRSVVGSPLR